MAQRGRPPKQRKIADLFATLDGDEHFSVFDKEDLRRKKRLMDWVTFYRRNLEFFVQHYLKIKLFPYQKIILHLMGVNDKLVWISARANAKSFTTALYCVCRCILYPNTKMVIVARKSGQAALIITEKIQKELVSMSPILNKEIRSFKDRQGEQICLFENGSYIKVVVLNDSSRGERSNCIIFEEFRLLDKKLIDSIIIPFNVSRKPPYTALPEYANLPQEQSQQVYISSAWWKNSWMWNTIVEQATNMVRGKKSIVMANDLYLSIDSGIKTKEDIFGEKATMDAYTFAMEYENQMIGEGNNSYYTLSDFDDLRKIKTPFVPLYKDEVVKYGHKNNPRFASKLPNEVRVLAIDVAMKAGKENDNTIVHLISATAEDYGYQRDVVYSESYNGKATALQALRIKQLFYEFRADYIVLDTLNAGISIYDELSKETIDSSTGEHYAPMTIIKDDSLQIVSTDVIRDLRSRVIGASAAIPVVYPVQATATINSLMAVDLKKQLEQKKIWLCADEQDMMDILMQTNKTFREGTHEDREFYIMPFLEHSELIKECVNLEMSLNNGNIKLQEPRDGRKDRYSALTYGDYFISQLERKILKEENPYGLEAYKEAMEQVKAHPERYKVRRKAGFEFL